MKFFWIFLLITPSLVFAQQPNTTTPSNSSIPTTAGVKNPPQAHLVDKPNIKKEVPSSKPKEQTSAKEKGQNTKVSPSVEEGALNNYFQQGTVTTNASNTDATPEIPSAWGPFFFLTFLIILIYIVIRFIKKKMRQIKTNNNPVDFIRTLASVPVTGNAQLAIVDIAGKFYLFGITTHSMELINEITDLDLILKIQSIPAEGNAKSFKEIFLELFGARNSKKISSPKSEEQLKKFIESQKNRIGNMK